MPTATMTARTAISATSAIRYFSRHAPAISRPLPAQRYAAAAAIRATRHAIFIRAAAAFAHTPPTLPLPPHYV